MALRILMVSSEAVPYAKTGGLADVAGILPQELAQLGHDVRLVIPRYRTLEETAAEFKSLGRLTVPTSAGPVATPVEERQIALSMPLATGRFSVLTIRHDPFFDRGELYQEGGQDYPDNLTRFSFFCRAVMELLLYLNKHQGWSADILHLHDWQTALCPLYLKTIYAGGGQLSGIRTVLTIHNLGYQGIFPAPQFSQTGLRPDLFSPSALEFYGSVNLLKGGVVFSDLLTTVSPTYSREIQTPEFGFGLEGVIAEQRDRLFGVINGIDTTAWNPTTDSLIPARYSSSDLAGKRLCKSALQREMKLPARNVPILAIVSRLSTQKGLDLMAEIVPELMELDLHLVILGMGDLELEAKFRSLQAEYPDKIGLRLGFDEGLAHRIQAGADIFIMPSRYEPCGLSQLYSLRYGTVPIVRKTGGLADTVHPYSPRALRTGQATGFSFEEPTAASLLTTVSLALCLYSDHQSWHRLIEAGMHTDVSWAQSARSYADLYGTL